MGPGGERLELGQQVLVLLLVAAHGDGLVGRDHVARAGDEDVEGLGRHAQGLDDEAGLFVHPGLVQTRAGRRRLLRGGGKEEEEFS